MNVFYKGYTIRTASPTGGKAGKGRNKTSTIQVIQYQHGMTGWYRVVKQFRFVVGDIDSYQASIQKAKDWINRKTGG